MSQRWGANPPSDDRAAFERLVDITEHCLETSGIESTTITQIARLAGVSRMTVYKHVSSLTDLVEAVFLREGERAVVKIEPALAACDTPEQRVVELVYRLSSVVPTNPGVSRMLQADLSRGGALAMAARSNALPLYVQRLVGPALLEAQRDGRIDPGPLDGHYEWISRTILSFTAHPQPADRPEAEQRQFIERFVVPSVFHRAYVAAAVTRNSHFINHIKQPA